MKSTFVIAALCAGASTIQIAENKLEWPVFDAESLKFVKPEKHPVDYPVPDFGRDHDIATTEANLKAAETQHGHTWTPKKDKDTEKWILPSAHSEKSYTYSRYMVDPDQLGELVGLWIEEGADSEFRPPVGSTPWHDDHTGSKRLPPPEPYTVPNFGVDHDIISTQKHIADAEKKYGVMKVKKDPKTGKAMRFELEKDWDHGKRLPKSIN